ncbi:RNase H domain-containing protein [Aphis craccivora]|uniref:RNase H domain-containing protein n=1 Tax=Aphis craccivora TaxID=307492 RepID=A0A6G0Y351_APHCR|nr:RNase H domain-containing protein [Aphis craccivora]
MFFTDASKTEKGIGIAIVHHDTKIKYRLPKEYSIFSAEAIAVLKTIEFIQIQYEMSTNNLVLTDSLSTLRSLENNTNPTDVAKNIQEKTNKLKLRGINITFFWVPGHRNISGNETANQAAKEAAQPNNLNIQFLDIVTYDDIKSEIKNKSLIKCRREKVLLNRLRIGHTRLTHKYLMAKEEPNQCTVCEVTLTVKHIITECYQYSEDLKKYNIPPNLYEALGPNSENTSNMLTFLKKSNLYGKI